MILDANTGQVLHNEDGDEQRHPASLTKMMTLYLAFETIEAGRMSMSDRVKISQEAANVAPSKLELEPGEDIAVADAIKAIITKSANDIAVAMAEKIGGSQANFVHLMNAKARELGMNKTHFENASGLPHNDQVTTARDMITLALRLQDDFPKHYPLFALREFRYNGASHRNHNTMLNSFAGIDGVKTGYTQNSGFNLVSSVHRGDKHLIGAVFGGSSAATRNGEMRVLLTRALTKASSTKTRKPVLIAKLKAPPKLAERPAAKPKQPILQVVAAAEPVSPKPVAAVKPAAAAAKPQAAAKQPAPEPAPVPEPTATAEPESDAAPQPAPVAVAAPAPVELFKVRRVMVAPRKKAKPAAPSSDETTDMAPEGEEANAGTSEPSVKPAPRLALGEMPAGDIAQSQTIASLAAAASVHEGRETVVPKKAALQLASALDNRMSMLGAADAAPQAPGTQPPQVQPIVPPAPPPAAPVTATALAPKAAVAAPKPKSLAVAAAARPAPQPVRVAAQAPVQRGTPPSTLQAQAAAIAPAAARPQVVASLQPQMAATSQSPAQSPAMGRFEIQIGAFASVDEAQRNLTQVQSRTGALLAKYPSVTLPVQKAGRQIFRARFRGFDSQAAANTCTQLRRQAIDCFVMTAE